MLVFRNKYQHGAFMGSGCGAVGRAVALDTSDQQVESSHRLNLYVLPAVLKRQK